MSTLLSVFDLVGIFVFALSGGVLAVRHRLDLFGVLVLACVTAVTASAANDTHRVRSPAREVSIAVSTRSAESWLCGVSRCRSRCASPERPCACP